MRLALAWLMMSIAAMAAISGCTPETRYKTLSFFFDGVPLPEGSAAETGRGEKEKNRNDPGAPQFRKHGPYAAKMCEACHRKGGGELILPVEKLCQNCHALNLQKRKVHGPVASGGCRICHHPHGSGKAFLLVSEPSEFCFYCHDKTEVSSRDTHKAAGDMSCTDCHNPHSSDNDYMLK
jgi:predicted CXXCH cytochrome family protein